MVGSIFPFQAERAAPAGRYRALAAAASREDAACIQGNSRRAIDRDDTLCDL